MFVNTNGYNLGSNEDGLDVSNVVLPPWAKTPEDFVRIMRMVTISIELKSVSLHHCYFLKFCWLCASCYLFQLSVG